jgi:light-harvesting complex I chlorophyll a/b binding protein 1
MIAKLFAVLACLAGVSAFAPKAGNSRVTSLSAKSKSVPFLEQPKKLDGSYAGDVGFDPAGFLDLERFKYTKGSDSMFEGWTEEFDWAENVVPEAAMMWGDAEKRTPVTTLQWMREAELKHGRMCMLAVTGWISVDCGLRFPGQVFADIPSSLAAHDMAVANGSMQSLLMLVGFLELMTGAAIFDQAKGSGRAPGDFSFDPLKLSNTPDKLKLNQQKEIKNARLAMLAFAGVVTQSALHPEVGFPYVW